MAPPIALPETFARAVAGLRTVTPRPEITVEEVGAPQRLAPYAFALSAAVLRDEDEVATGRLILLHDPAGHEAWQGTLRLVTYVTAELEVDLAADPLLPGVGWTWLVDALEAHDRANVTIVCYSGVTAPPGRHSATTSPGTWRRGARCSPRRRGCRRPG